MKNIINKIVLLLVYTGSCVQATSDKNIAVIGAGYVGLVLAACLADCGHTVTCADIDEHKICGLQEGRIPLFESGLEELVQRTVKHNRLFFTCSVEQAIRQAEVLFIAVGTPMSITGKADLRAVKSVARTIADCLDSYKVICVKSTVPIGTGDLLETLIKQHTDPDKKVDFDIVSNPEFLKEGSAVTDCLHPDRIVLGVKSERALALMKQVYKKFIKQGVPLVVTNKLVSAETIKYASNAFLAVKLSYINELAKLCDQTKADIVQVAKGMSYDVRIGSEFLKPGPGYGGSCFPKDAQELLCRARALNTELRVLHAAVEANEAQKQYIFDKFKQLLGQESLEGKTVAILGLAFKAHTDDVRFSPAITFIQELSNYRVSIKVYDPAAQENMKKLFPDLDYTQSAYQAITGADAVVLLTEWPEFKTIDLERVKSLVRTPIILDARNILNTQLLSRLGFNYANIGNACVT